MRILAITNLYPRPGRETFATFNRQQFRALADQHDVEMIAPVPWTERLQDWRAGKGVAWPYTNEDGLRVSHPVFSYPPKLGYGSYGFWYLKSVGPLVRREITRFRPDVLFSCWAHPDGWAVNRLGREFGIPTVLKIHGSDVLVITENRSRRARVVEAVREAGVVATVSQSLAEAVIALGADPSRVRVAHEGLEVERFRPGDRSEARARINLPAEGRIVLFVGNLLWSKGVAIMTEAFRLLKERGRPFQGYLVGKGRDCERLKSLIARHDLGKALTLVGPLPHDQLPDWYRASDLVVLPSYSEGIPNVLRESASCGCPFVATRVGGIPEISAPSYSHLIEPGSPVALADGIELMLGRWFDPQVVASSCSILSWAESSRLLADCCQLAIDRASNLAMTRP